MPGVPSISVALPIALLLSIAGGGCDPEAPGASGTITLGAGVDATVFQTLALRSFPNMSGPYDPSEQIPGYAYRDEKLLAGITFPYHYRIGGDIGTSEFADWQMVAWLSHRPAAELRDATGADSLDAFCSVAFRVAACGFQGGFCGVTDGIDCVLAPTPASP